MLHSFVAALVFASTLVIATNEGIGSPTSRVSRLEQNDPTEGQQATSIPTDNKFLASLRFWEKGKSKPQSVPEASEQLPHQPKTTSVAKNTPVDQSNVPVADNLATGLAPEPPPNPFTEHVSAVLGDAPLPRQSPNFVYDSGNSEVLTPQEAMPRTASYLSYSFDTRDWVEFFPGQQAQDAVREGVAHEEVAVTQKTSLRLSESNSPHKMGDEDDDWNGHATTLIASVQHDPLQTAATSVVPDETPAEKPQIDLSPSYQKRLPYVQTCGVVVVQANFPLTEIASILDEINLLQHDLNRYVGVPDPKEKIELCLFKDKDSYTRFLREFFPRAPTDRRALYVKLDQKPGTLMVQKLNDFEVDLRHEMTHAIVHASIPMVPIWLDEGLAKYFEVPPHDRAGKNPYMSQIRWNVRMGTVPSLDRLAKLETIDDMGTKEYRDSWAWTHFLIHRSPETHRLLAAYLQLLAKCTGTDGEYSATGSEMPLPGRRTVGFTLTSTREKDPWIPSLKLYLDDIVPNQREAFKEHFNSAER